jgi:hypothetical protein
MKQNPEDRIQKSQVLHLRYSGTAINKIQLSLKSILEYYEIMIGTIQGREFPSDFPVHRSSIEYG